MAQRLAILLVAILASACAATPAAVRGPNAAAPPTIPPGSLDLGDWRNSGRATAASQFESAVGQRYAAGLPLNAVSADLRDADFRCADPPEGALEPPAAVCRRSAEVDGCNHVWQVMLYATGQTFERARPAYDRACGSDGLLGGPS